MRRCAYYLTSRSWTIALVSSWCGQSVTVARVVRLSPRRSPAWSAGGRHSRTSPSGCAARDAARRLRRFLRLRGRGREGCRKIRTDGAPAPTLVLIDAGLDGPYDLCAQFVERDFFEAEAARGAEKSALMARR